MTDALTSAAPVDIYTYFIVALLPLSACMLIFQVNPYHALVLRGILGAIAALVYAVLGAADVALTEALMGTMLAITLYAVAVRSSLVLRLGVINQLADRPGDQPLEPLLAELRTIFGRRHHLRLELVPYPDRAALHQGLMAKEVHVTCVVPSLELAQLELAQNGSDLPASAPVSAQTTYQTTTRLKYLYEIMQAELSSAKTQLSYLDIAKEVQS